MCNDHIGNVVVGSGSSIWFGSVVRGDNEPIVIGERINIQDGCTLCSDPGSPLRIGDDTTVGHRAVYMVAPSGLHPLPTVRASMRRSRRDRSDTPNLMLRLRQLLRRNPV